MLHSANDCTETAKTGPPRAATTEKGETMHQATRQAMRAALAAINTQLLAVPLLDLAAYGEALVRQDLFRENAQCLDNTNWLLVSIEQACRDLEDAKKKAA